MALLHSVLLRPLVDRRSLATRRQPLLLSIALAALLLLPPVRAHAQTASPPPPRPDTAAAVRVARLTFREAERALAKHRWARSDSTVRCEDEGKGGGEFEVTIDRDSAGVVRHFAWDGGTEDHAETHRYFYDAAGRLRFAFLRLGAVNGTKYEERVYYDGSGAAVRRLTRLVKGPGYTVEHEQGVVDPAAWLRGICR